MSNKRPYTEALARLRAVNLRPTRQRLALAKLLFSGGDRHITAESLHREAQGKQIRVSLATVYNALHQFTEAGLLRQVVVDATSSYFDTNTRHHHHFFSEDDNMLTDIPDETIDVSRLPTPPAGQVIDSVDVVVRVRKTDR